MEQMYKFLTLSLLALVGVEGQQCLNEYGEPVDWFFLYKLPKLQQPNNFFLRKGLGYIYLTSKHPTADWRLGMRSMNDSKSIVGHMLSPLYEKAAEKNLFYVMYNDDPPSNPSVVNYGHTKGVVASDGQTGFWLVHSSPQFPIEPVSEVKPDKTSKRTTVKVRNSYSYPQSATKFGQSFLCVTLGRKALNNVGILLMYDKPKIYSVNIPDGMEENFPNLTRAAQGEYIEKEPHSYITTLKTVEGTYFTAFAKSKLFEKDLYSALIAPHIGSNLEVETWQNGRGDLPSDCKGNFTVKNIIQVGIRMEQNLTYLFKSSQDHSKWAVSDKDKSTVCVGDINRMSPQLKRGGGSVCLRHPYVWNKYIKAVFDVEPCSQHTS